MVNPQLDRLPGGWTYRTVVYLDAEYGLDENYRRQVYALGVTKYDGLYIGLFTVLEWPKDESSDPTADVTRIYYGSSRDGIHFDLRWIYAGEWLVGPDQHGKPRNGASYDYQSMRPAAQLVTHGGLHWLYYESCPNQHERRYLGGCEIRLARFQRDMLSYLASHSPGWGSVVTKAFRVEGSRLEVGVNVASTGAAKVAILNRNGEAIAGFTCMEAVDVESGPHSLVLWSHGSSLTALRGTLVQLKFFLHDAELFAFQILA